MTVSSETSQAFIQGHGEFSCRCCSEKNLFSALDLEGPPIANELLRDEQSLIEKFPLHLRVCIGCGKDISNNFGSSIKSNFMDEFALESTTFFSYNK